VRGTDEEIRTGLLGYLSVFYGALILDGIVLRKTTVGRFALSFPARTDRWGRLHAYIAPIDDNARRAIEREILSQLGQRHADQRAGSEEGES
jgi:hypothetical protein